MKYYIPKYYLSKLNSLVKALSKKTKVVYKVYDTDTHLETAQLFVVDENTGGVVMRAFNYLVIGVELEVDYKIGDYELVAELEHTDGGNIIRKINYSYDVPEFYRSTKCYCEHCKTNRYRKNTFLLVDKSGNYKQVGSNCLNEYTGVDSEALVNKCSNLSFIIESITGEVEDEAFKEYLKSNWRSYESVEDMANLFYQLLLKNGYKKEANNPFDGLNDLEYKKELEPEVKKLLDVINTDWYEEGNDYCYNVSVVLKLQYIEVKHWRILMSYLNSAMIYLQKKLEREMALKGLNNNYLGEVGKRIEFDVKAIKLLYTKWTNYSYNGEETYVYRILTTTNSVVIWSTGNILTVEDDKFKCYNRYFKSIKATIKSLEEYKGEKQTVVTRGSVIYD